MPIRPVQPTDAPALTAIYNHYVAKSTATFETQPIDASELARRIEHIRTAPLPWLVLTNNADTPLGYAYAAPWKPRAAYRHTVETSIYLHPDHTRRGLGPPLYNALLSELRALPVRAALAGLALPNDPSVKLHERLGFAHVGTLHAVGWNFNHWIDVGYWQRALKFRHSP